MKYTNKLLLFTFVILNLSTYTLSMSISKDKAQVDLSINSERKHHSKAHARTSAESQLGQDAPKADTAAASNATQVLVLTGMVNATTITPFAVKPITTFNASENSLTNSLYKDLNKSYVHQDINTFKASNRNWNNNKLFEKQIEDIYQILIYRENKALTPYGARSSIELFTSQFDACDGDKDQILNLTEFTSCMQKDAFLKSLPITLPQYATHPHYAYSNSTGYYGVLYNLLDTYKLNYLNFHDYMTLRLYVFSWKKCSVSGPFIEETSFECAIEIASGWKTMSRNTARNIYSIALELSNTKTQRNLDFISYVVLAQAIRLYGKINNKEDSDATKLEFNLALDSNYLPARYNEKIIDQIFQLVSDSNNQNEGIDIHSFIFYDTILRLFDANPNPTLRWNLNFTEFKYVFDYNIFPSSILSEIQKIPQNNITTQSYNMFIYLNHPQYNQEADHFLKFIEKKKSEGQNSIEASITAKTADLPPFNLDTTAKWLFNIIDNDGNGLINFYDWGSFMQIGYIFQKADPYNKGKVVAGNLYDKFSSYSDFPTISSEIRERGKRFNLLPQDTYVDFMRALTVLKIDDIINANTRRVDPSTLNEIDMKYVLNACNLGTVNDILINKCLRGVDVNNVPKYDWECSFIEATKGVLSYLESSAAYNFQKSNNITLANTVFVNVDPQLSTPAAAPAA